MIFTQYLFSRITTYFTKLIVGVYDITLNIGDADDCVFIQGVSL